MLTFTRTQLYTRARGVKHNEVRARGERRPRRPPPGRGPAAAPLIIQACTCILISSDLLRLSKRQRLQELLLALKTRLARPSPQPLSERRDSLTPLALASRTTRSLAVALVPAPRALWVWAVAQKRNPPQEPPRPVERATADITSMRMRRKQIIFPTAYNYASKHRRQASVSRGHHTSTRHNPSHI